jgi:hypothetical protein
MLCGELKTRVVRKQDSLADIKEKLLRKKWNSRPEFFEHRTL